MSYTLFFNPYFSMLKIYQHVILVKVPSFEDLCVCIFFSLLHISGGKRMNIMSVERVSGKCVIRAYSSVFKSL